MQVYDGTLIHNKTGKTGFEPSYYLKIVQTLLTIVQLIHLVKIHPTDALLAKLLFPAIDEYYCAF
jgi:hypothetical protein